jgi:MFS transporter, PPP family, 3-phenylpropionic acid transporter
MNFGEATRLRILYFLAFSCTAAWLPIFADYLKDHGLSGFRIGIILSITPLLMLLVQPFYGMLADHFGYRICLLISSILAAASYVFYVFDGGFTYLMVVTIFMSIFYNSTQPLLDSISLTFIRKNPAFSYGSLRIAGAAGWAFTGIIIGYFIDNISTTVIFVSSAISMFLTFVFAFALHYDREKTPSRETESDNKKETLINSFTTDLQDIVKNRTLMFLLFCLFLVYAASSAIYYFYSIYLKQNGASSSLIGFAISFQGLCELPFYYFSARILRKLGIKTTLVIAVFATALRLILYHLVSNPYFVVPIELLHGVGWSLFWVASVEQVNILVKEKLRATGQSFLSAAILGAGAIAGNLWTGFLYEKEMRVADIFILNAGIVILIGIFMMLLMPRTRRLSTGLSTSQ